MWLWVQRGVPCEELPGASRTEVQTLGTIIIGNSVYGICSLTMSLGTLASTQGFLAGFRTTRTCCTSYFRQRTQTKHGRRTGMGATHLCVSRFVRILGLTIVHSRIHVTRGRCCNLSADGGGIPSLSARPTLTR